MFEHNLLLFPADAAITTGKRTTLNAALLVPHQPCHFFIRGVSVGLVLCLRTVLVADSVTQEPGGTIGHGHVVTHGEGRFPPAALRGVLATILDLLTTDAGNTDSPTRGNEDGGATMPPPKEEGRRKVERSGTSIRRCGGTPRTVIQRLIPIRVLLASRFHLAIFKESFTLASDT